MSFSILQIAVDPPPFTDMSVFFTPFSLCWIFTIITRVSNFFRAIIHQCKLEFHFSSINSQFLERGGEFTEKGREGKGKRRKGREGKDHYREGGESGKEGEDNGKERKGAGEIQGRIGNKGKCKRKESGGNRLEEEEKERSWERIESPESVFSWVILRKEMEQKNIWRLVKWIYLQLNYFLCWLTPYIKQKQFGT